MLCCNVKAQDIWYAGPALALYFQLVKLSLWIALAASTIHCLASIFLNSSKLECQQCSFMLRLTLLNSKQERSIVSIESYLACATSLVSLFLLQLAYSILSDTIRGCDTEPTEHDYSLVMEFPDCTFVRTDIQEILDEWWFAESNRNSPDQELLLLCDDKFPVESVELIYRMESLKEFKNELHQLADPQNGNYENRMSTVDMRIRHRDFLKSQRCLVMVRYPQQKQYLLKRCNTASLDNGVKDCRCKLGYLGKRVRVRDPEQAENFSWSYSKPKPLWPWKLLLFLSAIILATSLQFAQLYLSRAVNLPQYMLAPVFVVASNIINYRLVKAANRRLFGCDDFRRRNFEACILTIIMVTTNVVIPLFASIPFSVSSLK